MEHVMDPRSCITFFYYSVIVLSCI